MTGTKSKKRPWLAALLSFFLPGLGHVYLRQWLRSAMWVTFLVSSVMLFVPIPDAAIQTAESGGMAAAWDAARQATQDLPLEAMLPIYAVRVLSAVDGYWLALQHTPAEEQGERCPACGKPVDEDLDFCQWCTTPLDRGENPDPDGPADNGAVSR